MRPLRTFLALSFVPTYPDLALLVLRLWTGLLMATHGWPKLVNFGAMSGRFADPFGLGSLPSLALAMGSELFGSILIVMGLFTRSAALAGIVTMGTAFFYAHGGALKGPRSGELALLFMGCYIVILLAGPGRFSLDGTGRGRR